MFIFRNAAENIIYSYTTTSVGELIDGCILITTPFPKFDFYIQRFGTPIITVLNEDTSIKNILTDNFYNDFIDFINIPCYDRIISFKEQYDIVSSFFTLNMQKDDLLWQYSVENLCYYLKPGGLLFINGFFNRTFENATLKFRSENLYKVVVNHFNCVIIDIIENKLPLKNAIGDSVIIIKKNE